MFSNLPNSNPKPPRLFHCTHCTRLTLEKGYTLSSQEVSSEGAPDYNLYWTVTHVLYLSLVICHPLPETSFQGCHSMTVICRRSFCDDLKIYYTCTYIVYIDKNICKNFRWQHSVHLYMSIFFQGPVSKGEVSENCGSQGFPSVGRWLPRCTALD